MALLFPDQLTVCQALADDPRGGTNEALAVSEGTGVESEGLLVEVAEEMERFDADVGTVDGSFQETPEVLQAVGMNPALGVALGVVDHLVLVVLAEPVVGLESVSEDLGAGLYVLADLRGESASADVGDDLDRNGAVAVCPVPRQQTTVRVAELPNRSQ